MATKNKNIDVAKMLGGLTKEQSAALAASMNTIGNGKPKKNAKTKNTAKKTNKK